MEMNDHELARETHRLAKENNQMLHSMRRSAFIGGVIKFLIYAAMLLVPIWLYMTYVAPVMQQMASTVSEIKGTGVKVQTQFSGLQSMFDSLKSFLPGGTSTTTSN